jgi:ribosomal protein S18 acetylase RimI-like enzyme
MSDIAIHRAEPRDGSTAYAVVEEYYRAAGVVARDSPEEFARMYFAGDAGVWLASAENRAIAGCIALRRLLEFENSAEIKRLYVRPAFRGSGIAKLLLTALERFARDCGYRRLYLDTASDMLAAQRFYRDSGYLPCARYNDNPQAAIFLMKELK